MNNLKLLFTRNNFLRQIQFFQKLLEMHFEQITSAIFNADN